MNALTLEPFSGATACYAQFTPSLLCRFHSSIRTSSRVFASAGGHGTRQRRSRAYGSQAAFLLGPMNRHSVERGPGRGSGGGGCAPGSPPAGTSPAHLFIVGTEFLREKRIRQSRFDGVAKQLGMAQPDYHPQAPSMSCGKLCGIRYGYALESIRYLAKG